jgi:hypothetical protein
LTGSETETSGIIRPKTGSAMAQRYDRKTCRMEAAPSFQFRHTPEALA